MEAQTNIMRVEYGLATILGHETNPISNACFRALCRNQRRDVYTMTHASCSLCAGINYNRPMASFRSIWLKWSLGTGAFRAKLRMIQLNFDVLGTKAGFVKSRVCAVPTKGGVAQSGGVS
eukprot:5387137-Amphidinium_carterae.1